MKLHLILGNKNYSSWSLRPWIMLARTEFSFSEQIVPLSTDQGADDLKHLCPAGLVPVLMVDGKPVWESLAILETIAELFPEHGFLPESLAERALLRSVCAEMHSGFVAIRSTMPMNCRAVVKLENISEAVQADIDRIDHIWSTCRIQFTDRGRWLFGHYSLADAMFAPVVSRFNSYQIELSHEAKRYSETVMSDSYMQKWYADSEAETWVIDECELPFRK